MKCIYHAAILFLIEETKFGKYKESQLNLLSQLPAGFHAVIVDDPSDEQC